jgi:hypothetical protein
LYEVDAFIERDCTIVAIGLAAVTVAFAGVPLRRRGPNTELGAESRNAGGGGSLREWGRYGSTKEQGCGAYGGWHNKRGT